GEEAHRRQVDDDPALLGDDLVERQLHHHRTGSVETATQVHLGNAARKVLDGDLHVATWSIGTRFLRAFVQPSYPQSPFRGMAKARQIRTFQEDSAPAQ